MNAFIISIAESISWKLERLSNILVAVGDDLPLSQKLTQRKRSLPSKQRKPIHILKQAYRSGRTADVA
jgi:hypothetical protein